MAKKILNCLIFMLAAMIFSPVFCLTIWSQTEDVYQINQMRQEKYTNQLKEYSRQLKETRKLQNEYERQQQEYIRQQEEYRKQQEEYEKLLETSEIQQVKQQVLLNNSEEQQEPDKETEE